MITYVDRRRQHIKYFDRLQIAPVATETFNVVKEKVADAAHTGQEAATEAARLAKEYAAAGAQKTQEVYNEYVSEIEISILII